MSRLVTIAGGPPRTKGSVVFIHGLEGGYLRTWGATSIHDQKSWLFWLAQDHPDLSIYSMEYPSSITEWWGSAMALPDRGRNLCELLKDFNFPDGPITFICHSYGGLALKQILRLANDDRETDPRLLQLLTRVGRVVFLSTPHTGAELAAWLLEISTLTRPSAAIEELNKNSAMLRDLNIWYRGYVERHGIENLVFIESQRTMGLEVVGPLAGDPGLPHAEPYPVDADHFSISKPESREDEVYRRVSASLRKPVKRIRRIQPCDIKVDYGRMPTSGEHFVGRGAETRALVEAWDSGQANIVVVDSDGGGGKTALVNDFVQVLRDSGWRGADGVLGFSFHSQGTDEKRQGNADEFISVALEWSGYNGVPIVDPIACAIELARRLAAHRYLILLDGLEPLQYPAHSPGREGGLRDERVATLIKQLALSNKGMLVITTRLALPELKAQKSPAVFRITLPKLDETDGITLLRACGVRTPEREMRECVTFLNGHPLSLNLLGAFSAGAMQGQLPVRAEMQRLLLSPQVGTESFVMMRRYEILLEDRAKEDPKRKAMDTAAGLQLAIMRIVGFFDGPVDRESLDALFAASIPNLTAAFSRVSRDQLKFAITGLRRFKLLLPPREGRPDELEAHPLVREYFARRTSQSMPTQYRIGHEVLYDRFRFANVPAEFRSPERYALLAFDALHSGLDAGRRRQVLLQGHTDLPAITALSRSTRRDLANLIDTPAVNRVVKAFLPDTLAAMEPLLAAVKHGAAAGMAERAFWEVFWPRLRRGHQNYLCTKLGAHSASLSCCAHFFSETWTVPNPRLSPRVQATVLGIAGNGMKSLGRLEDAARLVQDALQRQTKLGIRASARSSADLLAEISLKGGAISKAVEAAQLALQHGGQAGAVEAMRSHCMIGHALHQLGRLQDAHAKFKRADQWFAQYRPERPLLHGVWGYRYCDLLLSMGEPAEVSRRALWSLENARSAKDRLFYALSCLAAGRAATVLGNLTAAERYLNNAVEGLRDASSFDELPGALVARAAVRRSLGYLTTAEQDLTEAQLVADTAHMVLESIDIALERSRLRIESGQANQILGDDLLYARSKIDATNYRRRLPDLLAVSAQALLSVGLISEAATQVQQLECFVEQGWNGHRQAYDLLVKLVATSTKPTGPIKPDGSTDADARKQPAKTWWGRLVGAIG